VFTEISVPADYFADILKRQAVVNNGLRLIFREQTETGFSEREFLYEDGIAGYVKEFTGGEAFTSVQMWQAERTGRDREDKPEYKVKLGAALCFSNRVKLLEYYHNSSFLEHGGSPDRAVKVASVGIIDAYLKQQQKYLKAESKITFQDIEDCLVFVSSSFSTQTSYENQTKKAINNKFVYEAMTDFLRHGLEVYFTENPDEAAKIAEQVLINKRSRENAEKTRLNLKKKLAGGLDIANRVQKFVDCRSKDLSVRELYIVEGDSALGACKLGRDSEFQAIIPVRGKILNCLKAEYDKIFKNDIITDIIKVLGCGVEVNVKSRGKELSSFDISGLRWNKVVICTDADVDGFQIRALILTMLYRLTPTLINEGYVYIAESPLYEITAKDKTYFAYSDTEKNKTLEKISGKYTLQRSKGLGENEPDMMWLTTMNPKTRRLIRVSPTAASETATMFEVLLGDNLQGRKDFIAEFGQNYLEAADIS
jgi:DNA gyrase subunit B